MNKKIVTIDQDLLVTIDSNFFLQKIKSYEASSMRLIGLQQIYKYC